MADVENLSKPRSLVNDECYLYLKMDGMLWIIYEMLLTFDRLSDESSWDGSKPIVFKTITEMCVFLLKERDSRSLANKEITIKLHEDYINYDVVEFIKIHAPEIII